VGKTYKGFTDEEFKAITDRLLSLRTSDAGHVVQVRPEIVVEVVFDEVQRSPRYPSGYALRLARIKSIREDKKSAEADTIEEVARVYEEQFRTKGRLREGTS
jgi:DNA ligase 1